MSELLDSHPVIACHADIQDICRVLLPLQINFFGHIHVDKQHQYAGLGNNPAFSKHYVEKKYYNADIHLAKTEDLGKYVIWDALDCCGQTNAMNEDAVLLGVDHTFTIIEQTSDEKNFYHFGSNLIGKTINQEYIRHLDLLKKFILYFKTQVKESAALSAAYGVKYTVDEENGAFQHVRFTTNGFCAENKILSELDVSFDLPMMIAKQLSVREVECLKLYIAGMTAKQIAEKHALSVRTVENYICHIKEKLCVSTKAELINLCNDSL